MSGPQAIADVLRAFAGDAALQLRICDGIEHFGAGEIALAVSGDGTATVRHRRAGEEHRYAARLGARQLERLAARMHALGFAELRSVARDQARDELATTFVLRRDGDELVHAEIPDEDVRDDPRLTAIMDEFELLVAQISDGELPHGPAGAPR